MVALRSANINRSSRLSVYIFFYIFDVIFSTILIFFLLASNRDCPEAQKITDRGINYYQVNGKVMLLHFHTSTWL